MAKAFKACAVDGCKRNAHHSAGGGRGFCGMHCKRLRKHGDPMAGVPGRTFPGEPLRYIHEVVIAYEGDDCLIWPFARTARGYGQVRSGNHSQAHRAVCEIVNGPPPSLLHEAAHSCGKGHLGCVNPKHLRWATSAENKADRLIHGTVCRGERNGLAKLTGADVLDIRRLARSASQHEIARRFGVSPANISTIISRATWAWLE